MTGARQLVAVIMLSCVSDWYAVILREPGKMSQSPLLTYSGCTCCPAPSFQTSDFLMFAIDIAYVCQAQSQLQLKLSWVNCQNPNPNSNTTQHNGWV